VDFGTLDGGIFDDEVRIDFFEDEIRRYFFEYYWKIHKDGSKGFKQVKRCKH